MASVPYDGDVGIQRCLEYLRDRFDWQPMHESELIGLIRDSRNAQRRCRQPSEHHPRAGGAIRDEWRAAYTAKPRAT